MRDCIEGNMCDIFLLCSKQPANGYAKPYMREMNNIRLDLLVKGAILSLKNIDRGEWNDTIKEIEEILEEDHVQIEDEAGKLVKIIGYDSEKSQENASQSPKINFYMWSVFVYTYKIDWDRETRIKFLWRTILFPYIYKVGMYSPTTVHEKIEELLEEYPIVEGKDSKSKTLKILLQSESDKEFLDIVDKLYGIGNLLPSNGSKNNTLINSHAGWENFVREYKRVEEM